MEFADGKILVEVEGSVGRVIFNSPERRNAVGLPVWKALPNAIAILEKDTAVRSIVLTGAGEKAFVSGADISEFETVRCDSVTNHSFTRSVSQATAALTNCPKPVLAEIRGYCIGGGIVLATACDIRICETGSLFAVPPGKLGLGYELDNYQRLARLVGQGIAMEMVATARLFTAEEAKSAGLVNKVVDPSELAGTIDEYTGMIAATAPMSFSAAKLCQRSLLEPSLEEVAQKAIDACFDSEDFREGQSAFKEKRAPVFKGH